MAAQRGASHAGGWKDGRQHPLCRSVGRRCGGLTATAGEMVLI